MAKKLLKRDITKHLKALGVGWELTSDSSALTKSFVFQSFLDAFMFVTRLGIHAEVLEQYPEMTIQKNIVRLVISSGDRDCVTLADFALAERANQIVALSTLRARERARRM